MYSPITSAGGLDAVASGEIGRIDQCGKYNIIQYLIIKNIISYYLLISITFDIYTILILQVEYGVPPPME